MTSSAIYIGIRGGVFALDRATGQSLWRADLKGSDFVNVLLDNDRVLAATKGEVFCIDPATGQILWHNDLPGQGRGLITIATATGASNAMPQAREKQLRDQANSAVATTPT